MIASLWMKDLRLLRSWWWLIVPGYLLLSANGIVHPEVFFWMNVALVCAYTASLIVIDWTHDAERFVASLPVSRTAMVQGRYAGALGGAVLGTALYGVYGEVLLGLGGEPLRRLWTGEPAWHTLEGLLTFFLVVILLSTAFLPFYFRFGLAKGSWLFLVGLMAAIFGLTLLLRGFEGGAVEAGASVSLPSAALGRAVASVSGAGGPLAAVVFWLGVAAVLGLLSLRLSILFYEKRDL